MTEVPRRPLEVLGGYKGIYWSISMNIANSPLNPPHRLLVLLFFSQRK